MERLQETFNILNETKTRSDACLVSFSGGKDSLCVLDMCMRTFSRVECFFMYFVPGLEVIEEKLDYARKHYGVKIHQLPHWTVSHALIAGFYMFPTWKLSHIREYKLRDVYNLMIDQTGIKMIATGARRGDSLWRKRNLANTAHYTDVMHPMVGWGKKDVLAYLAMHKIPLPASSGGAMTGIGLAVPDVLWLHDNYPRDFEKMERVFPFVRAVVYRRDWYGIGA